MIGVDLYSFHRLLGEVRPGETAPAGPVWSWTDAVRCSADLGADVVGVETCYLGDPLKFRPSVLPPDVRTVLSWGHPTGLAFGTDPAAEVDMHAWMRHAADLGHRHMRIVVGHPRLRHPVHSDAQVEDSVSAVRRAAALAEKLGLVLAVENHADLTAVQLERLIRMVGSNRIRVCFDTANAVRVGDEVLEAAQRLSSLVVMAHIKDVTGDPWHPLSGPITAPLGSGVLPLHEVVALLADGHVELPLLVELGHLGPGLVDERHLVGQGIRWLRGNVP